MGGGIQHLKECGFLLVLCPLKCVESDGERRGEVVRVERRQLAEHDRKFCSQRELKCEFCGGAVRACDMNTHLGECEEFPVDCPNGCEAAGETGTGQMKRGAVPLHLSECPLQRVECPYREYGCGEEMERRQLDLHEREYMHPHFRLAMKEMKRKQTELNDKMKLLEKENTDLKETQIFEANNKINCLEKLSAVKDSEIISVNKEIKELKALSIEMKQKQTESNKLKETQIFEANNKIHCLEKLSAVKDSEIISVNKEIKELKALSIEMKQKQTESNKLKETQIFEANNKIHCLEKLSAVKDSEIISVNKEIKELKALSIEMKQKQTESNKLRDSQILEANNKINCFEKNTNLESISVKREIRELRAESNDKIKCFEKSSVNKDLEIISAKEQIEELKALSNGKIELLEKQDTRLKNEIKGLKEIISTLVSTGHLDWKIKGVKQKIRGGNTSYSDPFYVGLYKCQGYIVWDYNNTGKVVCFICIMKGEFDDKLKWPFIYRYKFVLFSQNRNEDNHIWSHQITKELHKYPQCFQKPTEIKNQGIGIPSFFSNTEILTKKYSKDDSISLLITVEQLPTF